MTPEDLRKLADEATPGPWRVVDHPSERPGIVVADEPLEIEPWSQRKVADARLIALAPDLARLCAELGEAAQNVYDGWLTGEFDWDELLAALAKLADLEVRG